MKLSCADNGVAGGAVMVVVVVVEELSSMCGAGSQTVPGRCALHKIMQPAEHELTCGVAAGASCTATAHLPHQLACKPGNVGFHTGCLESREVAQRSRLPEQPTHPQNAYALVTRHQPTRLQRLRLPTQALAQAPLRARRPACAATGVLSQGSRPALARESG